ncbi:HTH domain-containing protein [Streptomyces sp. G-G2]|uniref:telomere-protecting terminal protein Tpg n=1 Tax=Streptomyces sp. G-G2 TaxID=3046201 RepID=UPI0024B9BC5D|nr:HTH domain-containing protein [Streptomyces sp. G-G2]MDJ0385027.1 HTH domain-containing protein [Streptomyces sp. G-G2]
MSNDNTAARALLRDKLLDGLRRAERTLFTRPAPKSAHARMKFLRTREGTSKSLAERLGVSRKTVDRYLSGATKKPQKRLQAALEQETEAEWQPQVKAQARQRAATSAGLVISTTAYFGFGSEGSDAGRMRDIQVAVSPSHAAAILAARDTGATDSELHDLVAEAIADAYFRVEGGGRAGLKVRIEAVERLDIAF